MTFIFKIVPDGIKAFESYCVKRQTDISETINSLAIVVGNDNLPVMKTGLLNKLILVQHILYWWGGGTALPI